MQVETLEIQWKTFAEELPIRDVWIYVTPPNGGYLRANETTLMANANNVSMTDIIFSICDVSDI